MWPAASPFPSPGTPGEGRVRVCAVDAIRQTNINRKNPHPDLLPEYREKEKCALRSPADPAALTALPE